ncbi:DNA gyrase subunit A [Microbacteriaceae bacterium MWH-Ta3]|nr:DNA gyrase subunit A [Microbacteriaceae bacterium MWH-Ta3]
MSTSPSVSERIDDVDLSHEMQGSFLEYAYSVIYSRALPDARDGMKPVQRRILYQMAEMGLRPERGYVKSARVVGEVMGKLHPHGDSAIYDALVRLSQSFTLRVPFVDGHGNFGSLDDGPAASRYTEAKLRPEAMAMVDGLDEDVVDFVPNYDGSIMQPSVLPSAFPSLLVNGASGIAVGMATNMAPHNLTEVIAAARHLIENPDATLDELMEFVPGPDLPTGGVIVGLDGIREAYATGKGSFRTRARSTIEHISARKQGIVITELPYLVGPERVIERIKDGVAKKKIIGISNVTDLTDRKNGLRLVIEVKTGFSPEAVLEQLYKLTPIEDGFSINNVALVDGRPQTLGLKDMLRVFVEHRIEVVSRRSAYRLARRQERLHLVDGLLIAILDIDDVIQVIRTSDDVDAARTKLQTVFDLSQIQAEYILELRLRRLTKFSRVELESERDALRAEIASLTELLASPRLIRATVSQELSDTATRFGTARRTSLMESAGEAVSARTSNSGGTNLEIEDLPCRVLVSTTGRAVRIDAEGDIPVATQRTKHDALLTVVPTTVRGDIAAVTSRGRLIRFSPVDLPSAPMTSVSLAAGSRLSDYVIGVERGERIVAVVPFGTDPIGMGTRRGVVKRVDPSTFPNKSEFGIFTIDDKDEVIGAAVAPDTHELVFVSHKTQLLHFPASQVRPQGIGASGVAGINLSDGDVAITFASVEPGTAHVVTVTAAEATLAGADPGRAKVTLFSEFPGKGRGTGGVRAHALLKGEIGLSLAWVGVSPLAVAADGSPRELPVDLGKRDGSGSPLADVIATIGESAATFNSTTTL